MAVAVFNKKQFEKEIGQFNEEMQTKVAMFGTPIDRITDSEIHVEVFPNRPDLLSYHGFKRSFMAFLEKKTGMQEYSVSKPEKDYNVIIDSSVKDVRPFTACAIVRGLDLNDEKIKELIDMQEKLHLTMGRKRKKVAIGIYPLEKIKLPIHFKAVEPDQIKFTPLDTEKELSGLEILQKHPTGKEYAHLLSGKAKFPIFIDSANQILSMPPIINSKSTGRVTSETKDVFVECSGSDFAMLCSCLNIVVTAMAEMGAKIYQMELKYGFKKEITPNLEARRMKISIEKTNKLLGLELKEKQVKQLIEKMGYNYKLGIVEIPAWRTDILHEVDLIEDIAIAYGYENFIPEIPKISTIGEESKVETIKRKMSEIFSGLGFLEVSNYHLTNKEDQGEKMNVPEKTIDFVEILQSKTEYNAMRKNLSHYLLKNHSENVDSEYPQKIFEIGWVFELENGKISEKESLAASIAPGNFTEIKQALEYFSRMLALSLEVKEVSSEEVPDYFVEGRTGKIVFANKTIGFIGEVHPKILRNWKIKMPIALFEIGLEEIFRHLEK